MEKEGALENLAYALKCTMKVATRRKNARAITACEELMIQFEMLTVEQSRLDALLEDIKHRLYWLISDLLAAIKFEMREVLIPFIEVKGPTHEFGTQMFPDFFRWLREDKTYTPEELVTMLEDDTDRLLVASEHLEKTRQSQSPLQWS